jgi:hypothetical protein
MLKKSSYILLVFQTSLLGLMLGLFYTKFSGSAEGQGLAAGGILVFNAMIGLTTGILSGVFAVIKLKHNTLLNANIFLAIINLVGIITMMFIIKSNA